MSILAFMQLGQAMNRATPVAGTDNTLLLSGLLAVALLLLAGVRYQRRPSTAPAQ